MPYRPFADSSRAVTLLAADAPAKLNLGLRVLRKRPDGFHDLETTFLPLAWADHLTADHGAALSLACSDPALPTDADNLVLKAAHALAGWAGIAPRAALTLEKRLPYGAGLGGGSSDAAAALRLLADLWTLDVPRAALHDLAASLGSDVPFFLVGAPALATGRGERLAPLLRADGTPWRCPFALVVAVPAVHVPTAEAYGLVVPNDRPRPDLRAAVLSDDFARWRREISNDFEAPIAARHAPVAEALQTLRESGAGYAAMSGSGSAVFGVFEDAGAAASAAERLAAAGCRTWTEAPA